VILPVGLVAMDVQDLVRLRVVFRRRKSKVVGNAENLRDVVNLNSSGYYMVTFPRII